jgi:hypothetical protein
MVVSNQKVHQEERDASRTSQLLSAMDQVGIPALGMWLEHPLALLSRA